MASLLAWFSANQWVLVVLVMVLDHVIAANPALQSNSLIQLVLGQLDALAKSVGPQAPKA